MKQEKFQPQIAIGPRVRKAPFFEATKRYGVKSFTIYNHMYMPTRARRIPWTSTGASSMT